MCSIRRGGKGLKILVSAVDLHAAILVVLRHFY